MNKKKQYNIIFSRILLAVLLITMILPIRALASEQLWDSDTMPSSRQKPRLLDNADLLTDSEEANLLALLDTTSEKWQCNIVLLTVDDHIEEIQDFVEAYDENRINIEGITKEDLDAVNELINQNVEFVEEDAEEGAQVQEEAAQENEAEPEQTEAAAEEDEYFCPECGAKITLDTKVCPNCGIELEFEEDEE